MKISPIEKILVQRQESHFDRACDAARGLACAAFHVDDAGYVDYPGVDWNRSTDSIILTFVGYRVDMGMMGGDHTYEFSAYIDRYEEQGEAE